MNNNIIRIHVLRCGSVELDEALPIGIRSKNPFAYLGIFRSLKHRIKVPVFTYLIEHPKGIFLIDTGYPIEIRSDSDYFGRIVSKSMNCILPEGEAISEQLNTLGIKQKDINMCIITHMDNDHIGGVQQLKEIKKFLVSQEELIAAKKFNIRYIKKLWKGVDFFTFKTKQLNDMDVKQYDLLGDNTILLTSLPGHTQGNTGVIVRNNGKFVLITGDSAYQKESWNDLLIPGIVVNKNEALKSLKWIKKIANKENCIEILSSHDFRVKPHIIEL